MVDSSKNSVTSVLFVSDLFRHNGGCKRNTIQIASGRYKPNLQYVMVTIGSSCFMGAVYGGEKRFFTLASRVTSRDAIP